MKKDSTIVPTWLLLCSGSTPTGYTIHSLPHPLQLSVDYICRGINLASSTKRYNSSVFILRVVWDIDTVVVSQKYAREVCVAKSLSWWR